MFKSEIEYFFSSIRSIIMHYFIQFKIERKFDYIFPNFENIENIYYKNPNMKNFVLLLFVGIIQSLAALAQTTWSDKSKSAHMYKPLNSAQMRSMFMQVFLDTKQ